MIRKLNLMAEFAAHFKWTNTFGDEHARFDLAAAASNGCPIAVNQALFGGKFGRDFAEHLGLQFAQP